MRKYFILFSVLFTSLLAVLSLCSFSETDDFFRYEIDGSTGEISIVSYVGSKFSTTAAIPSEIEGHKVTKICEGAFYGNEYLEKVTVPDSVTIIDEAAFGYCSSLKSVEFTGNEGSITIDKMAFSHCSSLKTLIFSERDFFIDDHAFEFCIRLGAVEFRQNIKSIGYDAFSGCEQLIMLCSDSPVANKYAIDHSIPQSFKESDNYSFLLIAIGVSASLALIFALYKIPKHRKKISKLKE